MGPLKGGAAAPAHGPAAFAGHLGAALSGFRLRGPAARRASAAAIAVCVAVVLALELGVEAPWWAGISAWVCMQSSASGSLERGAWRLVATVAGAAVGFLAISLFVFDHAAMHVALFALAAIGHRQQLRTRYTYAWLLGTVTALMVIYAGLAQPELALRTAWYRAFEVAIGVVVAWVAAILLFPDDAEAPVGEPSPRRDDLWRTMIVGGLTVSLLPTLWDLFELPGIAQFAVSAIVVVQPAADEMHWKGLNRVAGCLFGGALGLVLVSLAHGMLVPWLAGLAAAMFLFGHLHVSASPISYAGTQAGVALILAMVQGPVPTADVTPAIERLFAICGGLAVLTVVALAVDAMSDGLSALRPVASRQRGNG